MNGRIHVLLVLLSFAISSSIVAAGTVTICIGDKDCFNNGTIPCLGDGARDINSLDYAEQQFINRTDSVMNDNFQMLYRFYWDSEIVKGVQSATIVIHSLDVEPMGDGGSYPVYPIADGDTLEGQALVSCGPPWPGNDDEVTLSVFNLTECLIQLEDGYLEFAFPPGGNGDNVAFDFVELEITFDPRISTENSSWSKIKNINGILR